MKRHPVSHVRRNLVRGLILVLPLLITVWLLGLLFQILDTNITPLVRRGLEALGMPGLERWFARLGVPIIGLLLTASCVYLIGLVGGNLAGRRLLAAAERGIRRLPVIKSIYGGTRQLLDAFGADGRQQFARVVAVEYPRPGLWTLGFVTREFGPRAAVAPGDRLLAVFLPTTPNPTSGWVVLLPERDSVALEMSVEDAVKLIVSGGIVAPEAFPDLLLRSARGSR